MRGFKWLPLAYFKRHKVSTHYLLCFLGFRFAEKMSFEGCRLAVMTNGLFSIGGRAAQRARQHTVGIDVLDPREDRLSEVIDGHPPSHVLDGV